MTLTLIETSKDVITELYKNLSFKTFSGEQQIEFEKISDLFAHINFKMKNSILLNLENQDKDTKKKKTPMNFIKKCLMKIPLKNKLLRTL